MKQFFGFAVAALIVLSFTSCKKDYTCTCKGDNMQELVITLDKYKKADAEDACTTAESTYVVGDPTVKCTLN